jgi:glutamyl-tRNA reductase
MSDTTDSQAAGLELVGISHHSAPIQVLEGLALSPDEVSAFYAGAKSLGAQGALVLSTCNRTEIYAQGDRPLREPLTALLRQITSERRFPESRFLYHASGRDGVLHLFRVASGLDSMVLGEAQILGQVKEAFEQACTLLPPAPGFERAVRTALIAAKRSRSETEIGKGAVSVASAAVHLATRTYSDLARHTVLIVGAGETGGRAPQSLRPGSHGRGQSHAGASPGAGAGGRRGGGALGQARRSVGTSRRGGHRGALAGAGHRPRAAGACVAPSRR